VLLNLSTEEKCCQTLQANIPMRKTACTMRLCQSWCHPVCVVMHTASGSGVARGQLSAHNFKGQHFTLVMHSLVQSSVQDSTSRVPPSQSFWSRFAHDRYVVRVFHLVEVCFQDFLSTLFLIHNCANAMHRGQEVTCTPRSPNWPTLSPSVIQIALIRLSGQFFRIWYIMPASQRLECSTHLAVARHQDKSSACLVQVLQWQGCTW